MVLKYFGFCSLFVLLSHCMLVPQVPVMEQEKSHATCVLAILDIC
jgi:hypothetical protein